MYGSSGQCKTCSVLSRSVLYHSVYTTCINFLCATGQGYKLVQVQHSVGGYINSSTVVLSKKTTNRIPPVEHLSTISNQLPATISNQLSVVSQLSAQYHDIQNHSWGKPICLSVLEIIGASLSKPHINSTAVRELYM